MPATPSIFAQIVDQVRLMNEEQQKLLWLQLNLESIYSAAAKADSTTKGNNVSMDEIIKMTRHVRRSK
jgi:predicted CoA-binding protein